MAGKHLTLKLLINKEKNKVVFVESDKDFVNILFNLLTLPIGKIVRLLNKRSGIGNLDKLYASVEDLDTEYLQTEACKAMLLHPRRVLEIDYDDLLGIDGMVSEFLYVCPSWSCCNETSRAYSLMKNTQCPCGMTMSTSMKRSISKDKKNGAFVRGGVMFLISDDLHVSATSMATLVNLLNRFGFEKKSALEERTVDFGKEEFLNLLSRTLVSKTPLTDVFLRKLTVMDAAKELELKGGDKQKVGNEMCFGFSQAKVNLPGSEVMNMMVCTRAEKRLTRFPMKRFTMLMNSMRRFVTVPCSLGSKLNIKSKEVKLKLIGSRCNNKVVCAEVGEDFVELLFSFLTIPLGAIVMLLDENSALGCIDNLYRSVKELTKATDVVTSEECKYMLLSPKIATHFSCSNRLLRLDEEPNIPAIIPGCHTCFMQGWGVPAGQRDGKCKHGIKNISLRGINPKLANRGTETGGGFVKGPGKFLVNVKLEVRVQSPLSAFHVINKSEGFLDDFDVRDLEIGKLEVLKLLRACLTSRAPLSDVFPFFSEKVVWP